jgi:hypothetical protein
MRFVASSTLALVLTLPAVALAQEQPQPQPEPQQQAQQPEAASQERKFTTPAGLMFNIIKADQSANFEQFLTKLHEALYKSAEPKRQQQAAGWKVYKMSEPAPGGNVMYLYFIEPTVDHDYTGTKILVEGIPDEAAAAYELIKDAYAGLSMANMTLVADFSKAPAAAPPAPEPQQ